MKTILTLLFVFVLFSCERKTGAEVAGEITYFKDHKTNLCFAKVENSFSGANNYSLSITCVPCENVKHVLDN